MTEIAYPVRFASCPCCALPATSLPRPGAPAILNGQCGAQWWADSGVVAYRSAACEELARRAQKIQLLQDGLLHLVDHISTPAARV